MKIGFKPSINSSLHLSIYKKAPAIQRIYTIHSNFQHVTIEGHLHPFFSKIYVPENPSSPYFYQLNLGQFVPLFCPQLLYKIKSSQFSEKYSTSVGFFLYPACPGEFYFNFHTHSAYRWSWSIKKCPWLPAIK